jgi:5'-nucleotidase
MPLLLSNDDGIEAKGLAVLAEAVRDLGDIWTVAPQGERSAVGHGLTMHEPLRVDQISPQRHAVSGLPADCIYLALHHLLPIPPRLVLAGINHGSNLGGDVFYSGTVAAAMEACLHGIPAIAFSLHRVDGAPWQWDTARAVARRVTLAALAYPPGARSMWSVNVPNIPLDELRGVRVTPLGERRYHPLVALRRDPRGREYFWIGGSHAGFGEAAGTDGVCITEGWATVTPLRADMTDTAEITSLRAWTDL